MNAWKEKLQADIDKGYSRASAFKVEKGKANLRTLADLVEKASDPSIKDIRNVTYLNVVVEACCFVRDERFPDVKKEIPSLSCLEDACLMIMRMVSQMNGGWNPIMYGAHRNPGDLPTPYIWDFTVYVVLEEAKKFVAHPKFEELVEEWEER